MIAAPVIADQTDELAFRLRGLLIGTAVGDALGLPAEGLSRRRVQRLYRGNWRHRLVFGRGMISDDTEHTVFVAQSLLRHPDSPERFARRLSWCLRGWLLSLPAGIGLATGRAIFKLWLGFTPNYSGVFSAGNGPAMRVAIIGAFFAHDAKQRAVYVAASTRITQLPRMNSSSPASARGVKTASYRPGGSTSIRSMFEANSSCSFRATPDETKMPR